MSQAYHIVIVDDDPETALLYQDELKRLGLGRVQVVPDVSELETEQQLKDCLGDVSLVILDIAMPPPESLAHESEGGLFTGCAVHKRIRQHLPSLRVISLSNLSASSISSFATKIGVPPADFYSKFDFPPLELAKLILSFAK